MYSDAKKKLPGWVVLTLVLALGACLLAAVAWHGAGGGVGTLASQGESA